MDSREILSKLLSSSESERQEALFFLKLRNGTRFLETEEDGTVTLDGQPISEKEYSKLTKRFFVVRFVPVTPEDEEVEF